MNAEIIVVCPEIGECHSQLDCGAVQGVERGAAPPAMAHRHGGKTRPKSKLSRVTEVVYMPNGTESFTEPINAYFGGHPSTYLFGFGKALPRGVRKTVVSYCCGRRRISGYKSSWQRRWV